MRIGQDAIPGTRIPIWFQPIRAGEYELICGQLCGVSHYNMKATVVVEPEKDFNEWLKSRAPTPAAAESPAPAQSSGVPAMPQPPYSRYFTCVLNASNGAPASGAMPMSHRREIMNPRKRL